MVMKSLSSITSSRDASDTPISSALAGVTYGSYPISLAPKPDRRSATKEPILPKPTIPMVFSYSSIPVNLFLSHLSALREALASGM